MSVIWTQPTGFLNFSLKAEPETKAADNTAVLLHVSLCGPCQTNHILHVHIKTAMASHGGCEGAVTGPLDECSAAECKTLLTS